MLKALGVWAIAIAIMLVVFFTIKWSWINIFNIWAISLTPNQSTSLAFLTYFFFNSLGRKNK